MQPLQFQPILKTKIWGGSKIIDSFSQKKSKLENKKIGESWELSDQMPLENNSMIVGGHYDGQYLREVLKKNSVAILGEALNLKDNQKSLSYVFPLLYKFIDAQDFLSVQVHPGCKGKPLIGEPKTECWYVVSAPPEAYLIVGLDYEGDCKEVLECLKTKQAEDVLQKVPVKAGDLFFVPAGTVHAITPGLFIYELQQNSDDTYRLYDWNRVDHKGNSRELHLEKASQVLNFSNKVNFKINPLEVIQKKTNNKEFFRAACSHFVLKSYEFQGEIQLGSFHSFRVLTLLQGKATFTSDHKEQNWLLGETILLPAYLTSLKIKGEGLFLESFVPHWTKDVINPLTEMGYSLTEIQALGQNFLESF